MFQITRQLPYTHDAIYLGNNRVVHIFMDEGGGISSAMAREDDWSRFINEEEGGYHGTVNVVDYRLRMRLPEEIVETAKISVRLEYGKGCYNIIDRNCQHFATFSSTGFKYSMDSRALVAIRSAVIKLNAGLPVNWPLLIMTVGSNFGCEYNVMQPNRTKPNLT